LRRGPGAKYSFERFRAEDLWNEGVAAIEGKKQIPFGNDRKKGNSRATADPLRDDRKKSNDKDNSNNGDDRK
jgi:hypothetical protein